MSEIGSATRTYEGFWLPAHVREKVLHHAEWDTALLRGGALLDAEAAPAAGAAESGEAGEAGDEARGPVGRDRAGAETRDAAEGAAVIRWPRLSLEQWMSLLSDLEARRSVSGADSAERWRSALERVAEPLAERMPAALPVLSAATGYSTEMLVTALAGGDLVDPSSLAAALEFRPTWSVAAGWETMPGLGGRARFFPRTPGGWARGALGGRGPLFRPAPPVALTLGYAAGNVPGTALIIALLGALANHAAPAGTPVPALLVRNSRHEPLFAPWVLSAVEEVDPELVAGVAVMIWDYADPSLQALLFRAAGLLLAAADDATIAALDGWRARNAPGLRFHRHGHKVSFATLGRGWEAHADAARLAALDSSVWDQNGCLSARVHFVETGAADYALSLAEEMRSLSRSLPRGTTPRRLTHRAFDSYASIAGAARVRVASRYDDDFAVVLDDRPWDGDALRRVVNRCQGRVVVVRPVDDVMQVPRMLDAVPAANLQSMSLLLEEERVESFARAAGARGVTALRGLGRGAFPQLAYSWDGLLPADVCHLRAPGHFTTIEPMPEYRQIEGE